MPLTVAPTSHPRLYVYTLSCWSTQVPATSPCTQGCATPSLPTGAGSGLGHRGSTAKTGRLSLSSSALASVHHPLMPIPVTANTNPIKAMYFAFIALLLAATLRRFPERVGLPDFIHVFLKGAPPSQQCGVRLCATI